MSPRRTYRSRSSSGGPSSGSGPRLLKGVAPRDGIKTTGHPHTWWGTRWLDAIDSLGEAYKLGLARGRSYARGGRVRDLRITAGKAEAEVVVGAAATIRVQLGLSGLSDEDWASVVRSLGMEARHGAELVAGRFPHGLPETTLTLLFPHATTDLIAECSCRQWDALCKHAAAVLLVLGEAMDRDPLLLFELRGRTRHDVLGSLSAEETPPAEVVPTVPSIPMEADFVGSVEAIPVLDFEFRPPATDAIILRQLGHVPGTSGMDSWSSSLLSAYRRSTEEAQRMVREWNPDLLVERPKPEAPVMLDPGPNAAAPATGDASGLPGRDDILALLGRMGPLGLMEIQTQLHRSPEELKVTLKAMVDSGELLKMGRTKGTRYRLPGS